MRFDMEVRFDCGGGLSVDGVDPAELAQLGRLLVAFAEGRDNDAIGIEGGRTKYVGDIQSIRVEANR